MSTSIPRIQRRPLLFGVAVVAIAGAIFSGGALTGSALSDDAPATPTVTHQQVVPGIAGDKTLAQPSGGSRPADAGLAGGNGTSASPAPVYPCQGDISGAVSDGRIDPAKVGLTPRFLGSGFKLQNLSLSSDGGCAGPDTPADPHPVLNTSWVQEGTSAYVNVTQRVAAERSANVLTPGMAQFWSGGYAFMVNASGAILPAGKPGVPSDSIGGGSASGSGSGSAGSGSTTPGIAPGEPYPGSVGDATPTLQAVIAQLAPDVSLQCFYRQQQGSWADLGGIGIGDPRSAIPSGFTESSVNVRTFTPPSGECGVSVAPDSMAGFDASFTHTTSDGSFQGLIYLNANADPKGMAPQVGRLDGYGAYWTNGKYSFNVGAKSNEPLGQATLRAIAKALDPNFDSACVAAVNTITEADARAAGFHIPVPPSGYAVDSSQLQNAVLSAGCSGHPEGAATGYSLQWNLHNGNLVINAGANRMSSQGSQPAGISNRGLTWTGPDGTQYSVFGYANGSADSVPQADLITVAMGLDPSLDPSRLPKQEDGGGTKGSPPVPLPATR